MVLVSPYELGRQPFGLAQPAAWLRREGFTVRCLDLSQQMLEPEALAGASLVAIHLAMHTATRIAAAALERIRTLADGAALCVYGLYAPVNRHYFQSLGVQSVLGGEFEPDLVTLAKQVRDGDVTGLCNLHLGKIDFVAPDRTDLPPLSDYARLIMPDGGQRVVGFAEASRGCKHLCRHCPIVPVYEGKFRTVAAAVVLADIDAQIAAGAQHISFGDPDFLNGPTHALKIARALHAAHPLVTYDATIKVEHLLRHRDLLPTLAETGCIFVTTAVESVDDEVLQNLAKNHTAADFALAVRLVRTHGISIAPTFVTFTPWSTVEGYRTLLRTLIELELVDSVPPVQLSIRLLIPQGSYLLRLEGFQALIEPFDPAMLGFPWHHRDPEVDALHNEVRYAVSAGDEAGHSRAEIFAAIWELTHVALGESTPALPKMTDLAIPHHSEPWYCCAEPTDQQLAAF